MSRFFSPDEVSGGSEVEQCAVCWNMWVNPREIEPCGHIFCDACLASAKECPMCRGTIETLAEPNQAIIRMQMRVRGRCSMCPWVGAYKDFIYNHIECLREGEEQATLKVSDANAQASNKMMDEYYLVDLSSPTTADLPQQQFPQAMPGATAAETCMPSAPLQAHSAVKPVRGGASTAYDRSEWLKSVTSTGADYGMSEEAFTHLLNCFWDFSTPTMTNKDDKTEPRLRWREACRMLRVFNYPNHPDDVENLFSTAKEEPTSGGVSFHALCLWLTLNTRNPRQWYNMKSGAYDRILSIAQVLDESRTGLFTLDQCRMLAEEYFERDLGGSEWPEVCALLRERDAGARAAVVAGSRRRRSAQKVGDECASTVSATAADVQLPFHDILLCFSSHVKSLLERRKAILVAQRRQQIVARIKRLYAYYKPGNASEVDAMLLNFTGDEENLLLTLVGVHGPEPS